MATERDMKGASTHGPGTASQRWVFLRGLGRHSLHWGAFPTQFQQAFPSAEIELLDLAGNGTEAARGSYLSIGAYAKDARQRSRFVKEGKTPFGILAISMGAMVASAWAKQHPGEVERMVLINTSSRADSRFYQRLRWQNYSRILQITMRKSGLLFRERAILEMTAQGLPQLEALTRDHARMHPTTTANFVRQMLASSRYSYPPRPDCPVLFLASERDNLVDPVCTRRLASRWRAKLHVHPGAGHDLPLLAPDWIIERVGEFLHQAR
jgi:pimeloyl-ACP methyl ester carboxylesterase